QFFDLGILAREVVVAPRHGSGETPLSSTPSGGLTPPARHWMWKACSVAVRSPCDNTDLARVMRAATSARLAIARQDAVDAVLLRPGNRTGRADGGNRLRRCRPAAGDDRQPAVRGAGAPGVNASRSTLDVG